ncbi:MAG: hypothetical protein JSR60_17900 [Proteobacteria bacterium]|nr:hypothetical protein [Pseudomonadota bacterium]
MPKYFRLLPAVFLVGASLLAIKGVDIARAAQEAVSATDDSGLAPSTRDNAPASPDFAGDDGTGGSPAEADVMSGLAQRRAELDARERALTMRENLLKAGEARVDQKVVALKQLQGDITALLAKRDQAQDDQIKSLIKTYSAMKPKDAARIFNTLNDDVLVPVAKGMKSDVLAPVLAAMYPDAAQKLTVKLASLLKLPDTAAGTMCPVPGAAADAGTPTSTASASPPGDQVAALSPPGVTPVVMPAAPPPSTPVVTSPAQSTTPTPPAPPPHASAPPAAKPVAPPKPHKVAGPAPAKPTATTPPKPQGTAAATPPAPAPAVSTPSAASTPAATATATPAPAATTPATPPKPETATGAPAPLGKP